MEVHPSCVVTLVVKCLPGCDGIRSEKELVESGGVLLNLDETKCKGPHLLYANDVPLLGE